MTDAEIKDMACCETKKLAKELYQFGLDMSLYPYTDPEIIRRAQNWNLTDAQMKPFNLFAIKLMRKMDKII